MITEEKETEAPEVFAPEASNNVSEESGKLTKDRGSIFDLFGSLIDDTRRLLRDETKLAKEEITTNLKRGAKSLLVLAIGAAALSAGFVALLVALSVGSVALIMKLTGLGAIPSILIGFSGSGLIMTLAGAFLVLYAKKKLSPDELKPERTVRTLKNTTKWAKEKIYE